MFVFLVPVLVCFKPILRFWEPNVGFLWQFGGLNRSLVC